MFAVFRERKPQSSYSERISDHDPSTKAVPVVIENWNLSSSTHGVYARMVVLDGN